MSFVIEYWWILWLCVQWIKNELIFFRYLFHSVKFLGFFCHSNFTWNLLWHFGASKTAILTILAGLNLRNFWNSQKSKFKASKIVKMAIFDLLKSATIWFHENQGDRKILRFPHCEVEVHSVEIKEFYYHLNFTWNHFRGTGFLPVTIVQNLNNQPLELSKMQFHQNSFHVKIEWQKNLWISTL